MVFLFQVELSREHRHVLTTVAVIGELDVRSKQPRAMELGA